MTSIVHSDNGTKCLCGANALVYVVYSTITNQLLLSNVTTTNWCLPKNLTNLHKMVLESNDVIN